MLPQIMPTICRKASADVRSDHSNFQLLQGVALEVDVIVGQGPHIDNYCSDETGTVQMIMRIGCTV